MTLFVKRGHWCYKQGGKLFKFATEAEAKSSLGTVEPEGINDASEEETQVEEEGSEETSSDE